MAESNGATPTTALAAPAGLSAMPGDRRVTLAWTDPGDPAITGYQFRGKAGGGGAWSMWRAVPGSGATGRQPPGGGALQRVEYFFELRAVNASGPARPPGARRMPPAAPAGLAAAVVGDTEVALSWDDPGDASIVRYELNRNGGGFLPIAGSNAATTGHTVTGLTAGTYTFQVRAVNASGDGSPSTVRATPGAVPAAPANLRAGRATARSRSPGTPRTRPTGPSAGTRCSARRSSAAPGARGRTSPAAARGPSRTR